MDEKKKGFDLAAVLKNVSIPDTNSKEQIEYIDIDLLQDDPDNFYQISQIEDLAANIEMVDLQQPVRVRADGQKEGFYFIVSGHRRCAAIRKLVAEGRKDLRQVACITDQPAVSPALQELRMIYANSDTRIMSSADYNRQVERVQELLYRLKEEGYAFPGRMRDHVAQACKISKSKLARLKVIREKLVERWKPAYEKGELFETPAYALAQLPAKHQQAIADYWFGKGFNVSCLNENLIKSYGERLKKISKHVCTTDGTPCQNKDNKSYKAMEAGTLYYCGCTEKCCADCSELAKCKRACPKLADRVAQIKADTKEQRKQEKLAQEKAERPVIRKIQALWDRFGQARNAAGVSVEAAYKALGRYCYLSCESDVIKMECLEGKFAVDTKLPYDYNCRFEDIEKFNRLADLFGCSLDYLFCRTDEPKGTATGAAVWHPGAETPEQPLDAVAEFTAEGLEKPLRRIARWTGSAWQFPTGASIDAKCIRWTPLPPEE